VGGSSPEIVKQWFRSIMSTGEHAIRGRKFEISNLVSEGDCLFLAFRTGCEWVVNSPWRKSPAPLSLVTYEKFLGMKRSERVKWTKAGHKLISLTFGRFGACLWSWVLILDTTPDIGWNDWLMGRG